MEPELKFLIQRDDIDAVLPYIERTMPDIFVYSSSYYKNITILMIASEFGATRIISKCVELGANFNAKDKEKRNALWYAVSGNHKNVLSVVQTLIDNHIEVSSAVLKLAINKKLDHVASLLVNCNADATSFPSLFQALNHNLTETANSIVAKGYNYPDKSGATSFMALIAKDSLKYSSFIQANIAVLYKLAFFNQLPKLAYFLIQKGFLNILFDHQNSLLFKLVEFKWKDCIRLYLYKNGAVHQLNNLRRSCLSVAVESDNCDIVRLLIAGGADLQWKDKYGFGLLTYSQSHRMDLILESAAESEIRSNVIKSIQVELENAKDSEDSEDYDHVLNK